MIYDAVMVRVLSFVSWQRRPAVAAPEEEGDKKS